MFLTSQELSFLLPNNIHKPELFNSNFHFRIFSRYLPLKCLKFSDRKLLTPLCTLGKANYLYPPSPKFFLAFVIDYIP